MTESLLMMMIGEYDTDKQKAYIQIKSGNLYRCDLLFKRTKAIKKQINKYKNDPREWEQSKSKHTTTSQR